MPKQLKLVIGIVLLPACIGAGWALVTVIQGSGTADTTWVPMLAGMICWGVIYALLPKPMWVYVFGHELTHAIWTWGFGGRVKKFKADSNGGHVVVTRSNFLIALAPYFFPLYAAAVVLVFVTGHWIWDWSPYLPWFHLLLGAAYAFHVTLTWHVLKAGQPDITQQGYVFSASIIFLGNVLVLLLGVPLLTSRGGVTGALVEWFDCTIRVTRGLFHSW